MGATNTFRVLGLKAGSIVTLADILKGTVATLLPLLLFDVEINRLLLGLFAVIGHTYPIFAKFKGGKAVATSGGIFLGRSEEHTSELQSRFDLVCRLLLEKKKKKR